MTFFNSCLCSGAALLLSLCAVAAHADEPTPIENFTLKNGMEVVLIPSARVPAVTHMLWYRVGAADDYVGRSGLAHYNEHMMFQGTEKVPAGEFAQTVSRSGGHMNAFTSHDYTAYYVSIAKEHLPLIMQMEADRMLHLAPSAENFAKEREVIIEERRMSIENRPEALLAEEMEAALYRNHPYHTPNIGWMHEMKDLSREDVLAFHKEFYHPANAILVVAGDITRKELEPLAEKYYGTLAPGERYVRHWRMEPPERAARHVELSHANVKEPQFSRFYIAPSVNSADKSLVMPSFVLAQILGGGTTSRFYQSLVVKQKLATSVDVDYSGIAYGPGDMSIHATPAEGVSLPALEAAIDKQIADARAHPATQEELARARTLLKAEAIYTRDGMEGMARTLGMLVTEGLPPDYFNRWPALIEAVTEEDTTKAFTAIFDPRASVTGYLSVERKSK